MSAFQSPFLFSLNQLSHLSFMGHQNFNTNALSYQNDTSTANMNSNHPNGININALNASPCSSTMETPFLLSFSQEIHNRNPSKQYSQGKWTQIEERLYNEFVKDSAIRYFGIDLRRSERKRRFYFNAMSSFIGTRSSAQCRSHDQKMREKLWFSSKSNCCSCKKPRGQNREQEEDDMMINFEENHHMDMMVGRGMMKQIELGAVDLTKKKPGDDDVDRFFSFGSEDQGKGSSGVNLDHQSFRGPVINSEFGRSNSWNEESFNLSPSHWSDS